MAFSWVSIPRPIIALAPMAGVTDAAYRQFIKSVAPKTVVFTEFLSTDALAFGARKTLQMLSFDPALERPFIVQVFGHSPEHFLEAAKVIEDIGADGIDINMGCPAAKVVSSCHGAALIRNVELATKLVAATKKAVKIPVSVKTRLGWNSTESLVSFCTALVEAGADALSVHGRRFCDKFSGKAEWEPIYNLKRCVRVPVIGNGDIATADDALKKIGNLDGVMVGRGTFGNPWLLRDIADAFTAMRAEQANRKPQSTVQRLTFAEKVPFILMHCELSVRLKGEHRGILEMRRHFCGYVKGFEGASAMRQELMKVEKINDVVSILKS